MTIEQQGGAAFCVTEALDRPNGLSSRSRRTACRNRKEASLAIAREPGAPAAQVPVAVIELESAMTAGACSSLWTARVGCSSDSALNIGRFFVTVAASV